MKGLDRKGVCDKDQGDENALRVTPGSQKGLKNLFSSRDELLQTSDTESDM